ncbi:unnamed protein product [Protopolystoma xenopodis]|uniref:Laminin EGF-like domain-containing protein n=1 Tax=Protopolystoma xenopodis TaxID=117903 RepID=A0A448WQV2_9PLAT|nr:unnamed protein product [Protopolystoma xenopodis]
MSQCACGLDSGGRRIACDPISGRCPCKAGYQGAKCNIQALGVTL